jgi:hypothetical protein
MHQYMPFPSPVPDLELEAK